MKDPESRTVFAGVDRRAEAQLPDWYAEQRRVDDPVSFAGAIRDLPRTTETSVADRIRHADELVETDRFDAIVEPSWLREQARGDHEVESLFHVPTGSHANLSPVDVFGWPQLLSPN